jgi:hypothetical protein
MDLTGSVGSEQGQVAGSRGDGFETLGSIKYWEFLE